MAAAVDRDEPASSAPGVVAGDGAARPADAGGSSSSSAARSAATRLRIDGADLGAVETRGEAIAEGALHDGR